jgi:hypothetical protein
MSFDPYNRVLKIRESIWDSNSQHGSSLGSVSVHPLTFFALPGACEVTPGSPFWLATFQPFALVASLRLGLQEIMSPHTYIILLLKHAKRNKKEEKGGIVCVR